MSSVNKVILIGNLGKDPDVRYMPSGAAVASITVATNEAWKDKQSGERQERTEWHNVVLFNRLGEIAGEYLRKGSKVYIEGRLQTRKYQDKNTGQDRYFTEIVANDMRMLDSRTGGSAGFEPREAPPSQQRPPQDNASPKSQAPSQGSPAFDNDFDDDIPF